MTFETKTTMELTDIETVEFKCKKCSKVTSYPITAIKSPPTSCDCVQPHGTQWMSYGGDTFAAVNNLLVLIKRLAEADEQFTLRFGVKGISASVPASRGKD